MKNLFTIAGVFLLMACLSGVAFAQRTSIAQGAINVISTDCAAATANGCVTLQFSPGTAGVAVQIERTYSATLQFEATVNGANWEAIAGTPQAGGVSVTSVTTTGTWQFGVSGLVALRVRASAYTSGQAGVIIQASDGTSPTNNTSPTISVALTTAGLATSANQTNGSQKTQVVDGSGNVLPTLPSGAVTAANSDSIVCATDTGCNPQALTTGSAILTYATTGGLTVVTVASGAHQVYGISVDSGVNTADTWVNLYDSVSASAGGTAPKMFFKIPGGTAPTGGGNDPVMPPMGVPFATGIQWFCSITNAGGASAAPVACGLNLQYK